jgi:hypothetical protein
MVIWIDISELETEFSEAVWKMEFVQHAHIDYATNAIHAWFEGKEVVLFRFSKWGWVNDNRENNYELTTGKIGITLKITKNK